MERKHSILEWAVFVVPTDTRHCRFFGLEEALSLSLTLSFFYVTLFASFSRHNIRVCNVSNFFIVCLSVHLLLSHIHLSLYLVSLEDCVSLRRGVTSCSRIWRRISRNSTHESLNLPPIRETI